MQIRSSMTGLALGLAVAHATPLNIYNQCDESIELYDNSATETVAAGGSTSRTLAEGFHGMFRNGVAPQATLAEFSITGGFAWYDISIIPTGPLSGPQYCPSLEACEALTGGTGFNTPMQIAPSGCTPVTCEANGCPDAYQFPKDDDKTHACTDTSTISLTFCPGGNGGITTPTNAATTSAPTTAAPTPVPTTAAPTPVPTTSTPTPVVTTAAPTPVPTTSAPTMAPTPDPTTGTPAPMAKSSSSSSSSSTAGMVTRSSSSSSSASLDGDSVGDVVETMSVAPEMNSTPAPATSDDGSAESVSTQSEDSGTSMPTYLVSILGAVVVVGAVAGIVVVRRKKREMEAMEPKDSIYSDADILTPRTNIHVLNNVV